MAVSAAERDAQTSETDECCTSHRQTGCCDRDDCGPCCEACPTCPTLARRALRAALCHQPEFDQTPTALPDAALGSLCDAFVEANRAEFLDTDFDVPILRAVEALVRRAWHEGYGAGSSDATDGWLTPGRQQPRTNPYLATPPGVSTSTHGEGGDR